MLTLQRPVKLVMLQGSRTSAETADFTASVVYFKSSIKENSKIEITSLQNRAPSNSHRTKETISTTFHSILFSTKRKLKMATQYTTTNDIILEKVTNIENMITKKSTKTSITNAIMAISSKEENIRASTFTIQVTSEFNQETIINLITNDWKQQFNIVTWCDKTRVFIKLLKPELKIQMINKIKNTTKESGTLKELILPPQEDGNHFHRKPIRLELTNIKLNIKISEIIRELEGFQIEGTQFLEPKEGKITNSHTRTLNFKTNSKGIELIFDKLDGCIPLSKSNTKVYPKIAILPWKCRNCFQSGTNHKCPGKLCPNCGDKQHLAKNCPSKLRNCSNCELRKLNSKGHRAKDNHCPLNTMFIIKELQRSDVPIEYLRNKAKRTLLVSFMKLN